MSDDKNDQDDKNDSDVKNDNDQDDEGKALEIYNGENEYLMTSSLFFLIPGMHALYKKQYLLSSTLLIGPIISYKFWSNPRNNIWRTSDMIAANMGMGLFIGNWAWNVKPSIYRLMIPSFYITGTSSYILGNIEHKKKNKNWYMYHGAMHLFMWLGHSLSVYVS